MTLQGGKVSGWVVLVVGGVGKDIMLSLGGKNDDF